jgi:hypothetical protein
MAKKKTTDDYIDELKRMVVEANDGKPFQGWLLPQLRATAMNMVILDKLQSTIEKEDSLTMSMNGSMGQQKIEVNPLLGQYYKAQQVLMDQFTLLGLTMKGKKTTGGGDDSDDPMASLYNEAKM